VVETPWLFACVDEGGGHIESVHVVEHDAVIDYDEDAFKVRVHDADVFIVYFGVLHHHHDGCEGVMHAAEEAEFGE
jgi:hypothetical protein